MRTNRRKMMINVIDMNVEYIMTNGHQFILTDWIPLTDTKIEMYFHAKDAVIEEHLKNDIFSSKGEGVDFSINNGGGSAQWKELYLWNSKSYESDGEIQKCTFEGYIISKTPLLFSMSKDLVEYYDEWILKHRTLLKLRTQPCTTPLYFFKGGYNRAKLYIYGIRCWNNGILERDFVPAKRNGIYGLYDKVNKKFWRSSSGVDFLGKDK